MKARLHPQCVGGEAGYVYSVICDALWRPRNPGTDAATLECLVALKERAVRKSERLLSQVR